MAGKIFSVMGIILIAKLLGFARQMLTASTFGATIETDLISLSQNVIGDLDYLLVQVFLTAFVPLYIKIRQGGEQEGNAFVSSTLRAGIMASLIAVTILCMTAPIIAKVIAPSYEKELSAQLAGYIRIYAPSIVLMVLCAIFNALLRAKERFNQGELVNVIQSVTVIVLILLFASDFGVETLIISYFVYTLLNTLFLAFSVRKEWKYETSQHLIDENVRQLMKMGTPLFIGYAMIFVNQQVDKVIVSGLGVGMVTAVGYAAVLSNLVSTFVGAGCAVLFTYIVQLVAEKKDKEAAEFVGRAAVLFTTVLLPIAVLTILNAKDIVSIVFGHGAFSEEAVGNTALALTGYALGIVFYAFRELFSRFQYSYLDSRRPMINSTIGIICNIVFSIVLSRYIGVLGVTLASAFSVMICAILNMVMAARRNPWLHSSSLFVYFPQWGAGGMICCAVSVIGGRMLPGLYPIIRFCLISVLSVMGYVLVCAPVVKGQLEYIRKIRM